MGLPLSLAMSSLFLMCACGSPAYYDLAIEYVSLNAWDMALHAFDSLRKDLGPPGYRHLALLWGIILNFGLSKAYQRVADGLAEAGAAVPDPSERLRFANEAFRLRHVGRVHQGATAELVGSLLELAPAPPRYVEVRLPKRYNFTIQPDSDEWLYRAHLEAGICPTGALMEGHVRQECSAYVIYTLGAWSVDGNGDTGGAVREKSRMVIDLARLCSGVGRDLATSGASWKEAVGQACLQRASRLLQDEQQEGRHGLAAGSRTQPQPHSRTARQHPPVSDAGLIPTDWSRSSSLMEFALVVVAGLCFSAAHIASLRAWGM